MAIDEYIRRFGIDNSLKPSTGALAAYLKFNASRGFRDCPNRAEIEQLLRRLGSICTEDDGGIVEVLRDAIWGATSGVSADFFFARHSHSAIYG